MAEFGKEINPIKAERDNLRTQLERPVKNGVSFNKGHKHDGKEQHVHYGYYHDEYGSGGLTPKDKALMDYILKEWERKRKKLSL